VLYRFLTTPGEEVTNLAFACDDVACLSWKVTAEENVPYLPYTYEVIGAYVTAGARNHRYIFLDLLQENAIYCDTDSVVFIQPRREPWPIITGDKLGHMQSELEVIKTMIWERANPLLTCTRSTRSNARGGLAGWSI
jgi:hypothetical protein